MGKPELAELSGACSEQAKRERKKEGRPMHSATMTEEEKAMRERFEKLHWVKKIDERIDHDELAQCITMMTEFYTEQAAPTIARYEESNEVN